MTDDLQRVLDGRSWLALSGAGISTDSGIPDYRGPGAPARTPMTLQQFRSGEDARRRYWARSYLGWSAMEHARPNRAHDILARLERAGTVTGVITQNVDCLHHAAGSREVVDLHGRVDRVICLDCRVTSSRLAHQERLAALNPGFAATGLQALPDGDVDLEATGDFVLAGCPACGGALKPDVVFFGENVPVERVERCHRMVEEAEALVVLGSSLHVFSGRRFVKRAHERGIPIVIVNRGETRADGWATLKIDGGCAETLQGYSEAISPYDVLPV